MAIETWSTFESANIRENAPEVVVIDPGWFFSKLMPLGVSEAEPEVLEIGSKALNIAIQ